MVLGFQRFYCYSTDTVKSATQSVAATEATGVDAVTFTVATGSILSVLLR